MFARRYFAGRYFAPRYFPQSQGDAPEAPIVTYAPQATLRPIAHMRSPTRLWSTRWIVAPINLSGA